MLRSLIFFVLLFPSVAMAGVVSGTMSAQNSLGTPTERIMRLGMQGDDVYVLQTELSAVVSSALRFTPTGYFGVKTENAVKHIQQKEGIVQSGSRETTGYGQVGPKTRTALRLASLTQICTPESKPSRQACLEQYYAEFAKTAGTARALALISGQVKREEHFGVRCHAVMHEIGHRAAHEYGSLGSAFFQGSDLCQNGYYHGVVEELLRNRSVASVSPAELRGFCANATYYSSSTLATLNCVHGIGHALIYMTGDNLPESLLRCGDMATDEHRSQCATGAFMQHWFAEELRGEREGSAVDLSQTCIYMLGDQESCWLVKSAKEISQSENGKERAGGYCRALETAANQRACTDGLVESTTTANP